MTPARRGVVLPFSAAGSQLSGDRRAADWPSPALSKREENKMSRTSSAASTGIGMGSALAMILSHSNNHSILWAMLHGICSWFYVIYFAIWK